MTNSRAQREETQKIHKDDETQESHKIQNSQEPQEIQEILEIQKTENSWSKILKPQETQGQES